MEDLPPYFPQWLCSCCSFSAVETPSDWVGFPPLSSGHAQVCPLRLREDVPLPSPRSKFPGFFLPVSLLGTSRWRLALFFFTRFSERVDRVVPFLHSPSPVADSGWSLLPPMRYTVPWLPPLFRSNMISLPLSGNCFSVSFKSYEAVSLSGQHRPSPPLHLPPSTSWSFLV